jgi:hypothetical protein
MCPKLEVYTVAQKGWFAPDTLQGRNTSLFSLTRIVNLFSLTRMVDHACISWPDIFVDGTVDDWKQLC